MWICPRAVHEAEGVVIHLAVVVVRVCLRKEEAVAMVHFPPTWAVEDVVMIVEAAVEGAVMGVEGVVTDGEDVVTDGEPLVEEGRSGI